MTNERRAVIYAMIAVALWSTVATGFKLGLREMEPIQLLFVASVLAWLIFVVTALPSGWPGRNFKLGEGVTFGLLNPVLYYLILFEAYARLPAHIAQPINYTWAIVLAILAVPTLGQPLTARLAGGILLSYAGVVILLSGGAGEQRLDVLGIALALASTLVWAGYWLFNTRTSLAPDALMATSFSVAVPVLAILCWLGPGWPPLEWNTLVFGTWIGVAEMGIAFLCWQRALRFTNQVARIGQLIFLSPFLSLLIIDAALGEAVGSHVWLALLVIVAGVWVSRSATPS